MNSSDYTVLRSGKSLGNAAAEWDRVGTDHEGIKLHLTEYLVHFIPEAHFDVLHYLILFFFQSLLYQEVTALMIKHILSVWRC